MAISYVGEIGNNNSKTTGTTLAVTATPGTQPAVGDLIVVTCGRDDIVSDPLTGDSLTDTAGNTWTRRATAGNLGTDGTGANGCNIITFYSVITSAWSGSSTVTWTHPSVDARSMLVQHWAPTSGYVVSLYGTPVSGSASGTTLAALTVAAPSPEGDLVVACAVFANAQGTTVTGASDTVGGSWSSVSTKAGTTGGIGDTNITCFTQYKIHTSPAEQTWNASIGTSSSTGNQLLSFHEMPATGIRLVGIGSQRSSAATTATPTIPPGAATGDLLLMVVGGRPTANSADSLTIASGTDGWAQHGSTVYNELGADDLSLQLWWKIHDGSESDPVVSINHAVVGGFGCQIAAFRGTDTTTPFDVTPVNSTNAAAATWTPTGVTTSTAGAAALSGVATADDNVLNFNTSQSFQAALGGAASNSTAGADFAVGLAHKIISSPGAVTMPTWNQSTAGNDAWAGTSTALKPASSAATINGTADGTFAFTGAATGTRTVPGTAASTFAFTGAAVGTRTTFGQAASTFTYTGAATGTRTVFGTAASSFTFTGDATGTPTVTGQAVSTFTFTGAATGTRAVLGQADGTFTFTGPAVGAPTITGTADGTFAFTASATGTRIVVGTAASTFTYTADAAGLVTHSGTADGTFTFTGDAAGSVSRTGSIDTLFEFAATAVGLVIPGINGTLRGRVLATVVDTSIVANVIDTPILVSVGDDRIEASVR